MGVHGLWELLAPVGRRVSVESLHGKVLAVDISIWLTQFIKAMRDEEGNIVHNAHVLGVFRRVLKLLYHNIRPVFVFDGGVPALKRRTIFLRQQRQASEAERLHRAARRLLLNRLRQSQVRKAVTASGQAESGNEEDDGDDDGATDTAATKRRRRAKQVLKQRKPTGPQATVDTFVVPDQPRAAASVSSHTSGDYSDNDVQSVVDVSESPPATAPQDTGAVPAEAMAAMAAEQQQRIKRARQRLQQHSSPIAVSDDSDDLADFEKGPVPSSPESDARPRQAGQADSDSEGDIVLPEDMRDIDDLDLNALASLPPETQARVFENLQIAHRMNNRKAFIPCAGDPNLFSTTQIDNFMRGRRLNETLQAAAAIHKEETAQSRRAVDASRQYSIVGEDGVLSEQQRSMLAMLGLSHLGEDVFNTGRQSPDTAYSAQAASVEQPVVTGQPWTAVVRARLQADERKKAAAAPVVQKPVRSIEEEEIALFQSSDSETEGPAAAPPPVAVSVPVRAPVRTQPPIRSQAPITIHDADDEDDDNDDNDDAIVEVPQVPVTASKATILQVSDLIRLDESSSSDSDEWEVAPGVNPVSAPAPAPAPAQPIPVDSSSESEVWEVASLPDVAAQAVTAAVAVASDAESDDWEAAAPIQTIIAAQAVAARVLPLAAIDLTEDDGAPSEPTRTHAAPAPASPVQTLTPAHAPTTSVTATSIPPAEATSLPKVVTSTEAALEAALATASHMTAWAEHVVRQALRAQIGPKDKEPQATPPVAPPVLPQTPASQVTSATGAEERKELAAPEVLRVDLGNHAPPSLQASRAELATLTAEEQELESEVKRAARDQETVTGEMRTDVMEMLDLFGIPYLVSPMEAEAQCAELEVLGLVDGVITDDGDAFLFGASKVYKDFFKSAKFVQAYFAEDVRKELGLNRIDFIHAAMLLGSDYTEGVNGVGIVNAMEILRAYPGDDGLHQFRDWLNGVLESFADSKKKLSKQEVAALPPREQFEYKHRGKRQKWEVPAGFPSKDVEDAYLHPTVRASAEPFSWHRIDKDALVRYCTRNFLWSTAKAESELEPIVAVQSGPNRVQRSITQYFMQYDDKVKEAEIRSKRLRTAVGEFVEERQSKTARNNTEEH